MWVNRFYSVRIRLIHSPTSNHKNLVKARFHLETCFSSSLRDFRQIFDRVTVKYLRIFFDQKLKITCQIFVFGKNNFRKICQKFHYFLQNYMKNHCNYFCCNKIRHFKKKVNRIFQNRFLDSTRFFETLELFEL